MWGEWCRGADFITFSLFIWLHWVFVAESGATLNYGALASHYSRGLLLLWITGSRLEGFRSCNERARWWCTGSVAPQHVGSSQMEDRSHVPCVGGRICITVPRGKSIVSFIFPLAQSYSVAPTAH